MDQLVFHITFHVAINAGCAANLCNVHKPDAAQSQDRQGGLTLCASGLPCSVLGLGAFSSEGFIHVCGNHSNISASQELPFLLNHLEE